MSSFFSFFTRAPAAAQPAEAGEGEHVVVLQPAADPYLNPSIVETYTLIGTVTVGAASTAPAAFNDFPLADIDMNPGLLNFSVSTILSVSLRISPRPHDVDWYAGIWATTPARVSSSVARDASHIRRRAPNAFFSWRSNITVPQPTEVAVPWPTGRPISQSLHAVMPGLHAPSLQIGLVNRPTGTASALPDGAYSFDVIIVVEVAGRGLFGHL